MMHLILINVFEIHHHATTGKIKILYVWLEMNNFKKVLPMFPLGLEPRTSRVLGERDNHYTMETS